MKELISSFTSQLREALEIGRNAELNDNKFIPKNVVIEGLGGSGIGGKIVSQLVADECPIPIVLNNSYHLPGFVNEETLVICSSFSGNTEETLHAYEEAKAKGAEIAIITSGGRLLDEAKVNKLNYIHLPEGDSPRAMLTYSLTQQFYMLYHYGLIGGEFILNILDTIDLLEDKSTLIKNEAKSIAKKIAGKTAVIYSAANYEGAAIRLRQQLNENAKVLCWHHALPEMNHNELVGWAGGKKEYVVLAFRAEDDFYRTQRRFEITEEVAGKYADDYIEIYAHGDTKIARTLYFILIGDWISVYLSELNGVDPIEVKVIDYLKAELAKI